MISGSDVKFKVVNAKSFRRKLTNYSDKKVAAFHRGLLKAGKHLKRKSQEVCPIDTGALRKSASVRLEGVGRQHRVKVIVSYSAPYAAYVHEMPQSYIKRAGKLAKYLETPAREQKSAMARIIRDEVGDAR